MREHGVKASFALGGIPAAIIDMYDEGLVRVVACSQSFDAVAARASTTAPGFLRSITLIMPTLTAREAF